jgi:hypothetical protein
MQGAATQVYAKAIISGVEKTAEATAPQVIVNGAPILTDFGYPRETQMESLLSISADFTVDVTIADTTRIGYLRGAATLFAGECYQDYVEATSSILPPTYPVAVVSGC